MVFGNQTIQAALITMIGVSLALPLCSYCIMLDTSVCPSLLEIYDSLDLDMCDSIQFNSISKFTAHNYYIKISNDGNEV